MDVFEATVAPSKDARDRGYVVSQGSPHEDLITHLFINNGVVAKRQH